MPDTEDELVAFERLLASWRSHRAPVADHLSPGLGDGELDAVERSTGLVLPLEMRRWWGWHDGVRRRVPGSRLGPESRLGVAWDFLSLSEALQARARLIELTEEFVEDDEVRWLPEWLPVVSYDSSYLFVACAAPRADRSEVRRWDREPDDPYTVRASSWTDAVTVFADLLESGDYTYSTETERWDGPERPSPDAHVRALA
ncbi:SMI1/KNR4 family protein [Actinoplanes sp. NPDC049668]|uniref:SMI1/KNR4 family protein n=1 Tax=unclassified Actinoplanes TaxID=2626549 RepID=UPI0033AA3131